MKKMSIRIVVDEYPDNTPSEKIDFQIFGLSENQDGEYCRNGHLMYASIDREIYFILKNYPLSLYHALWRTPDVAAHKDCCKKLEFIVLNDRYYPNYLYTQKS